jgi:hypothetical protein
MFCPECGTENARNQKFCTLCGTSLLALEYARSIVHEIATGKTAKGLEASSVLTTVGWVSTIGFITTMIGTIVLSNIYDHPGDAPVGLFFGLIGLLTLVLINWQLLRLISSSQSQSKPQQLPQPFTRVTNRTLSEGTQPYYSVTEEQTKPLENQR